MGVVAVVSKMEPPESHCGLEARPIFGFSACAACLRIGLMRALRCSPPPLGSLWQSHGRVPLVTESLAEGFRPSLYDIATRTGMIT
jgi:hypothetical protein